MEFRHRTGCYRRVILSMSMYLPFTGDISLTLPECIVSEKLSEEKRKLVQVTRECVDLGLTMVKPWNFLGDMAQVINDHARENGYSIVVEIGGHGVGLEFHEEPFVSYVTKAGTEMLMVPGMVFTIEPMVNAGTSEIYIDEKDGWTVYTADGNRAAILNIRCSLRNRIPRS